jgi:translocator protein
MRSLLVFIVLVGAVATVGAQFEPGPWYESLVKPPWTPPNWIFGPVWTVLYLAIAVSGWLVWREGQKILSPPLIAWVLQLVFNALWSWFFFGLHLPTLALVNILLLLATISAFIILAKPYSRLAAGLFIPYALWVAFAAALNFEIVRLN